MKGIVLALSIASVCLFNQFSFAQQTNRRSLEIADQGSFTVGGKVLRKFSAKNPCLRVAANR